MQPGEEGGDSRKREFVAGDFLEMQIGNFRNFGKFLEFRTQCGIACFQIYFFSKFQWLLCFCHNLKPYCGKISKGFD